MTSMRSLSREELRDLMETQGNHCVSIYMPAHRRHPEAAQDPIRFKNLLRSTEERLRAAGLQAPEEHELLHRGQALLGDREFWRHQSDGLAVFAAPGEFHHYRLPWRFPELTMVARRYHLKPLLQLLSRDGHFFVLAFSQNQVRFFEGALEGTSEITPENMPQGVATVIEEYELERQLQFRSGTSGGASERGALYHGHGAGTDDLEARVRDYLGRVDRALEPALRGEQAPLVLAAVEYLFPIYREVNSYAHLTAEGVRGNPDLLSAKELHARAWPIVEPVFQAARLGAIEQYREQTGTGRTSDALVEIVPAAVHGRIESLFVAAGVQRWGRFDADSGSITVREAGPVEEDGDLLDFAAIHTFLSGGAVFAVEPSEVPGGAAAAAVFRY
ncbi:MAG TPA: hypothetical protein VLS27_15555 [Gammaproteobacteria bacterium]|nr:hypothetical protein [Gammaproteobacteria bacterium]